MGLKLNGRYIFLVLAVHLAYLVQAVKAAGKCDAVFKGLSDCMITMGDKVASHPQDLEEEKNLNTVCTYWNEFHVCAVTALADCQEGAADIWEKLKKQSKNLNIQGSLFELCGGSGGSGGPMIPFSALLPLLMVSLLFSWIFQ
ncbi:hypothetical protein GDO86_011275 [Hymenochirus boettgeri]|uniref:Neuritin 1 n=1 Tax=Hymenochirus boettgeri TaxID=247094 RepID=A0A8T2JFT2_9PIPI|nr:hypothetical protein GDO86_011275 [Hymenochirus boettgeri]